MSILEYLKSDPNHHIRVINCLERLCQGEYTQIDESEIAHFVNSNGEYEQDSVDATQYTYFLNGDGIMWSMLRESMEDIIGGAQFIELGAKES